MEAVAYLDGKMGDIKKTGKVNGTDRIAVMAALNIAHEFLSTKLGDGFDIGQAKRRISGDRGKTGRSARQAGQIVLKRVFVPCCARPGPYFPNR